MQFLTQIFHMTNSWEADCRKDIWEYCSQSTNILSTARSEVTDVSLYTFVIVLGKRKFAMVNFFSMRVCHWYMVYDAGQLLFNTLLVYECQDLLSLSIDDIA